MDFPQYRKYPGNRSYFRIMAEDRFDELQVMGNRGILHTVKAEIYPDKLRIADMLTNEGGHWEMSNAEEFEAAMDQFGLTDQD